jgi:hypothetical protein
MPTYELFCLLKFPTTVYNITARVVIASMPMNPGPYYKNNIL